MAKNTTCCNNCNCNIDLSKCSLDMTIRECLEANGIKPEAVEKFLETCCNK